MLSKEDFRPVTVTETSYKLFGEIVKEKLSLFVVRNCMMREEQCGFVRERQLEKMGLFYAWR